MSNIAKLELESITELQKELHSTTTPTESIISIFYREFHKTTWYSSLPLKLKCTEDADELVYTVNNTFHYLFYTYMRQFYPAIKVIKKLQDKVRIAWPHNVGTARIISAQFKVDDDVFHSFDSIWCDIYFQFYMKPGFREHHNMSIGNVPFLEGWRTCLPSYTTNVEQPWCYSMDTSLAFPIFYCSTQSTVSHRYKLRPKVFDMLRMSVIEERDEHGNPTKFRELEKPIYKFLEGVTDDTLLRQPELWGQYAYVTDQELEFIRTCAKDKDKRTFFIKDVASFDTSNPNTYGQAAEIALHCDTPCLAMFWVAENIEAREKRNFSNYTTDRNNLYDGWDPIRKTSLRYGGNIRLNEMDSDHFSIAQPRKHFPSPPSEPGYHAYSFAYDSTAIDAEVGIVFAGMKASLSVKIGDGNIFIDNTVEEDKRDIENDEEVQQLLGKLEENKELVPSNTNYSHFNTRVRLLVLKKYTVEPTRERAIFSI